MSCKHTCPVGLDGVEIVMAVEDAFDIQIEDDQAERLITPRLLIDYVMGKVATTTATACLTQRAFNQLRQSLIRHCDLKRSQVTPSSNLSVLVPRTQRRETLRCVVADLAIKRPPDLVRSSWVNATLLGASVLIGLVTAVAAVHVTGAIGAWIGFIVAIAAGVIGIKLTKPLCTEFPTNLQNIGGLARWVMSHKPDLANAIPSGWTREQVAARVREIVVEVLGCKPDFSEDANFVKDLGLG